MMSDRRYDKNQNREPATTGRYASHPEKLRGPERLSNIYLSVGDIQVIVLGWRAVGSYTTSQSCLKYPRDPVRVEYNTFAIITVGAILAAVAIITIITIAVTTSSTG